MKKGLIILIVVLAVLVILAAALLLAGKKGAKAMKAALDQGMAEITGSHKITKLDNPDFSVIKVKGMNFLSDHYNIEGVGHLSSMTMNMGIMQMFTYVFTPDNKNLPLLSIDYIYLPGTRKTYVEYYDLVENKDEIYMGFMDRFAEIREHFKSVPDNETKPAWYDDLITVATYKKGGSDEELNRMLTENIAAYLKMADEQPVLTAEQIRTKLEITKKYTDGLIDNGGVSTDQFKSALGPDKTREFFDKVFFGTGLK